MASKQNQDLSFLNLNNISNIKAGNQNHSRYEPSYNKSTLNNGIEDSYEDYERKGGMKTKSKPLHLQADLSFSLVNTSKMQVPFNSLADRFETQKTKGKQKVGPGAYDARLPQENYNAFNRKGDTSFVSNLPRFNGDASKNMGPGPGQYFSESHSTACKDHSNTNNTTNVNVSRSIINSQFYDKVNVQHMFRQNENSNKFTKNRSRIPEVGKYNPQLLQTKVYNKANCAFKSRQTRFASTLSHNNEITPAPGQYNVDFFNIQNQNKEVYKKNAKCSYFMEKEFQRRNVSENAVIKQVYHQIMHNNAEKEEGSHTQSHNKQAITLLEQQGLNFDERCKAQKMRALNQKHIGHLKKTKPTLSPMFIEGPSRYDSLSMLNFRGKENMPGPGAYGVHVLQELKRAQKDEVSGAVFKSESGRNYIAQFMNKTNKRGPGYYKADALAHGKKQFHFNMKNQWV